MKNDVIRECTEKKLPFPEAVKRLREIGVERYYTDLVTMQKIYYFHDGKTFIEEMLVESLPVLSNAFNQDEFIKLLRLTQAGKIDYHTFLRNSIASGVANYLVYLTGKRVIYLDRLGETYIEEMPF